MPKKTRVDLLLVARGLAESRTLAQRLVMAGQVRADGQVVPKPSSPVDESAALTVERGPRFVSRGGEKLAAALETFGLEVTGQVCADVGASTGGFTDCLLQNGAARVYAIDVGKGLLHWNLRNDPRVVVMEETNARFLEILPEPVSFVTIDVSFISLKILLPIIKNWFPSPDSLTPNSLTSASLEVRELEARESGARKNLLALIKPQFEAGRLEVARGKGVVRDPEIHQRVVAEILAFAEKTGYSIKGLARSPVLGPKGNVEFLGWLGFPGEGPSPRIAISELAALTSTAHHGNSSKS